MPKRSRKKNLPKPYDLSGSRLGRSDRVCHTLTVGICPDPYGVVHPKVVP